MRIDIPTLKCDRCGFTTQDLPEMARFIKVEQPHASGTETWDLCFDCRVAFGKFIAGEPEYTTVDFEPLGQDVTNHTMYLSEPPHDDGRLCAYHQRLEAWVFYNPETRRRDLKCLRQHEKEFK
jgi:hypothetical protein